MDNSTTSGSDSKPTYTVVYDSAIQALGLRDGYVLCLVYRHSHMRRGVFSAGIKNKAEILELDHRQLRRALYSLKDKKLIVDLTPDRKNRPHDYGMTQAGIDLIFDGFTVPKQYPNWYYYSTLDSTKMVHEDYSSKSQNEEKLTRAAIAAAPVDSIQLTHVNYTHKPNDTANVVRINVIHTQDHGDIKYSDAPEWLQRRAWRHIDEMVLSRDDPEN